MRISQDATAGPVPAGRAGSGTGGWFQVAGTMGLTWVEDDAMGRAKAADAEASAVSEQMMEAMDLASVRLDRVVELRAAIAAGTYEVSASDIAERMMGRMFGGKIAVRKRTLGGDVAEEGPRSISDYV